MSRQRINIPEQLIRACKEKNLINELVFWAQTKAKLSNGIIYDYKSRNKIFQCSHNKVNKNVKKLIEIGLCDLTKNSKGNYNLRFLNHKNNNLIDKKIKYTYSVIVEPEDSSKEIKYKMLSKIMETKILQMQHSIDDKVKARKLDECGFFPSVKEIKRLRKLYPTRPEKPNEKLRFSNNFFSSELSVSKRTFGSIKKYLKEKGNFMYFQYIEKIEGNIEKYYYLLDNCSCKYIWYNNKLYKCYATQYTLNNYWKKPNRQRS